MDNLPGTTEARLQQLKEVKFVIPVRHHVNLHSWKLLQNKSISQTVSDALDDYFTHHDVDVDPVAAPAE